jgi:hemin uptake protein HemP
MLQTHSSLGCAVSNDPADQTTPKHETPQPDIREVNSQELMQGEREIVIRHGIEAYRLSVTRSGKLILRK